MKTESAYSKSGRDKRADSYGTLLNFGGRELFLLTKNALYRYLLELYEAVNGCDGIKR